VSPENHEVKGAEKVDLMIFKQEGFLSDKARRCN
jgi:hypothetical protein